MAAVHEERRERLRRLMREGRLDALLVAKPANRYYLSGFELHDTQCDESSGLLVVAADGRDWLATDARFSEAAEGLWDGGRILVYGQDRHKGIAELLRNCGGRIGFEEDVLTCEFARHLANSAHGVALEGRKGLVESLRKIKDPLELEAIARSYALNHRLMAEVGSWLVPGRSEGEIVWAIERFFRENGASELAFPSIVAVDANAAMPHALPGSTPVSPSGMVLVDAGCRLDDYCSDQTRTFWVGETGGAGHDRFRRLLDLVQKAQRAAIDGMRPGMKGRDVHGLAMKVFEEAGEGEAFTHSLGHGVGLQTHEQPSLSVNSDQVLEPGMVVTVEPGLYHPGWGGLRWEHAVVVEADGARVL
ncbi:MAG: aminopeptidase P family protein [Desulfovibrio sp.]|jgi:Xaa-Pro aminopeptidase|nr:aminopeptidase P family protein [Desulfovibrio sp.]